MFDINSFNKDFIETPAWRPITDLKIRKEIMSWNFNKEIIIIIIMIIIIICKIVDFAVSAESEKKDKYLDLARELKKLWNMKVNCDWCVRHNN